MKLNWFVCLLVSATLFAQSKPNSRGNAQAGLVAGYGKLPLSFEPNQGQVDAQAKFLSRGSGYTLKGSLP